MALPKGDATGELRLERHLQAGLFTRFVITRVRR
jgi:hypothetical protein